MTSRSRRQTVRIVESDLELVLEAIASDAEMSARFQANHVLWNSTFSLRLRELRACVKQGTWRVKTEDLDRILKKRVVQHLRKKQRVSTLARLLRKDLAMRLVKQTVAVEVQGLASWIVW